MPGTIAELVISKGWRPFDVTKSAPSASQSYWNIRGDWTEPFLGRASRALVYPVSSTSITQIGVLNSAKYGVVTTPTLATGSLWNSTKRISFSGGFATNSTAGLGSGNKVCLASSSSRIGGFLVHYTLGNYYDGLGFRAFIGVSDVQNPISTSNLGAATSGYFFGFGYDSGDAVANGYYLFNNNNTATPTKTQISAMTRTTSTLFDIWIWCYPGDANIYSWVWDLTNEAEDYPVTVTSTNIPLGAPMYLCALSNSGTTTSAITINIAKFEAWMPW